MENVIVLFVAGMFSCECGGLIGVFSSPVMRSAPVLPIIIFSTIFLSNLNILFHSTVLYFQRVFPENCFVFSQYYLPLHILYNLHFSIYNNCHHFHFEMSILNYLQNIVVFLLIFLAGILCRYYSQIQSDHFSPNSALLQ